MSDATDAATEREQKAHEAIKAYEREYENGDAQRTPSEHVAGLQPLYDELDAAQADVETAQN